MVTNIPLDRAYLAAIWLETLFYGEFKALRIAYLKRLQLVLRDELRAILVLFVHLDCEEENPEG